MKLKCSELTYCRLNCRKKLEMEEKEARHVISASMTDAVEIDLILTHFLENAPYPTTILRNGIEC